MKILMRGGKAPHDVLGAEASFARNRSGIFGANVGNLLFTNAVYRALNVPDADVIVDSLETESPRINRQYIERINEEFDLFVLPLANAFRPQFLPWLERLSHVIEQLKIPVVVVGVGAQLNFSGDYSGVSESTKRSVRRFMSAVLDRSARVGVRGEITQSFLEHLGFGEQHVSVIGCPSMYDLGTDLRVDKNGAGLSRGDRLAINITPSVQGMGTVLEKVTQTYPRSVYVPQEHRELALLLWGQRVTGKVDSGVPADIDHPLYREDRIRFFLDPAQWRSYLQQSRFAFGNRIHGNIAALTAGTPAVLLSHDSRTLELAEYHGIPFKPVPKDPSDIDPAELFEWAEFTSLNSRVAENFDRYVQFLQENSVPNIFQPGQENISYSELLNQMEFPEPVGTLFSAQRDPIIERIRWLWQSVESDQSRTVGAYDPPFKPDVKGRSRLNEVEETLNQLKHQLRDHESVLDYLKTPIEKRALQGIKVRARRLLRRS